MGLEIVASYSVSWHLIFRIFLLQDTRYRIFNISNVNVSIFANSSYLLCPDVRRAVGTTAATPPLTRSFFWSGAFLLALWKSWSSGPVRTWLTTVTTPHHIQGRRWSSMQNQVWAQSHMESFWICSRSALARCPLNYCKLRTQRAVKISCSVTANDGWWLTVDVSLRWLFN